MTFDSNLVDFVYLFDVTSKASDDIMRMPLWWCLFIDDDNDDNDYNVEDIAASAAADYDNYDNDRW